MADKSLKLNDTKIFKTFNKIKIGTITKSIKN